MTPSVDDDDSKLTPEPLPRAVIAANHDELGALLARLARRARHGDPCRVIPARRTALRLAGQSALAFRLEPVIRRRLDDEVAALRLKRTGHGQKPRLVGRPDRRAVDSEQTA